MPRTPDSAQSGFTLIELLIALGIMAVFALLAYRGLDSVLRLHSGAQTHEQQTQAIDRVITQLEADLRQASSVSVLPPLDGASTLRLRVSRRVGNELASVDWLLSDSTLERRTSTIASGAQNIQTAALLRGVTALDWLRYDVQWQAVNTAQVLAQPNQQLPVQRGAGLRLTVAGQALEKLFLVGR
jgi:general secretion pathway protein J